MKVKFSRLRVGNRGEANNFTSWILPVSNNSYEFVATSWSKTHNHKKIKVSKGCLAEGLGSCIKRREISNGARNEIEIKPQLAPTRSDNTYLLYLFNSLAV